MARHPEWSNVTWMLLASGSMMFPGDGRASLWLTWVALSPGPCIATPVLSPVPRLCHLTKGSLWLRNGPLLVKAPICGRRVPWGWDTLGNEGCTWVSAEAASIPVSVVKSCTMIQQGTSVWQILFQASPHICPQFMSFPSQLGRSWRSGMHFFTAFPRGALVAPSHSSGSPPDGISLKRTNQPCSQVPNQEWCESSLGAIHWSHSFGHKSLFLLTTGDHYHICLPLYWHPAHAKFCCHLQLPLPGLTRT